MRILRATTSLAALGLCAAALGLSACAGRNTTDAEPAVPDYNAELIGVNSTDMDVERSMRRYTYAKLHNYAHPTVSYDGKYLAYTATLNGPHPQVFVQEKNKPATRQITHGPGQAIHPSISYDSKLVAFASDMDGGRFRIYVASVDGTGAWEEIGDPDSDNISPSWSPDGKRIVYATRRNGNYPYQVAVFNRMTRTTDLLTRGTLPQWSPDGSQIVFQRSSAHTPGYGSIWTIRPDGSNSLMVYQSDTHGAMTPAWAGPDWILFATVNKSKASLDRVNNERYNADDVWMIHRNGSQARMVTSHRLADWDPCYDPAANEIVYVSNRDGVQNIYGMKANITSPIESSDRLFTASGR